jgi:excisionase family DNA binding protein
VVACCHHSGLQAERDRNMTPNLAELEQTVADTPVSEIPALIGILAELQAKAQLKMLSEQQTMKDRQDDLLTMRQVAARLNVPESRAYELARQGKLPAVRIGKYVRVSEKSLVEYQAKLPKA